MDATRFIILLLVFVSGFACGYGGCEGTDLGSCEVEFRCDTDIQDLINSLLGWKPCGTDSYVNYNKCDDFSCLRIFRRDIKMYLKLNNMQLDQIQWRAQDTSIHDLITTLTVHESAIPEKMFDFINLKEINIVNGAIQMLSLNKFTKFSKLINLNVSHNKISDLEEEESVTMSRILTIDLSYNEIKMIPNSYFILFSQLQHLNLSHNALTNFDILTFEGVSQLQSLDISHNQLLEIGLSFTRFLNVKEIFLNNNNLSSIDVPNFKTMVNLEKMNLSVNFITDIEDYALKSLSSLQELDLNDNRLSKINKNCFQENIKLHTLFLLNNKITKIESGAFKGKNITNFLISNIHMEGVIENKSFDGVTTDILDLSGGKLTALGPEAFTGLHTRVLNLSSNSLTNISNTSFKSVTYLSELDFSNNNLDNITFDTSDLRELLSFNARNNTIRYISRTYFSHLKTLSKLDLSFNKISKIESNAFSELTKLEWLDLSNNKLLSFLKADVFQGLVAVKNINLSNTRITSIVNESFSGLKYLEILNCSQNEITNLGYETFKSTSSIKTLDFSHNLLENFMVNTTSIDSIKELYLNNNKIYNVTKETFMGLSQLQKLYLNNNNIANVHPKALMSLPNVIVLDVSSNRIHNTSIFDNLHYLSYLSLANIKTHITFEYSTNVSVNSLDLSRNNIKNINSIFVYKVKNVADLDLNTNKITFIDKFSFQNMPTLTWLDLSFNLISFIQPGSFLRTDNIKALNLHGNLLSSLQFGSLDGLESLVSLNLSNNAIHIFKKQLLHNSPLVSDLYLDDNVIKNIEFDDFVGTNLNKITVGGNLIPCHVFTDLKLHGYKFNITAEYLDFHSENVNGIKCKSNVFDDKITWPLNKTDDNSTYLLAISNSINNFRVSISEALTNLSSVINHIEKKNSTQSTNTEMNQTNAILQKILTTNNKLTELVNQLTIANDNTINNVNIEDYLNRSKPEKDDMNVEYANTNETDISYNHLKGKNKDLNTKTKKMIDEIKEIFQDMKTPHDSNNYEAQTTEMSGLSDIKALMYFMAICLTIITLYLLISAIFNIFRNYLKPKANFYGNSLHTSMQPMANVIELQDN